MMWCFKNAQPVKEVSIQDRALQYGDGCFTTARIEDGKIQLMHRHLARLKECCEQLDLSVNLNWIDESLEQMKTLGCVLTGTIKILISRGEGQRGYTMPSHAADLYIYFYPQSHAIDQPAYLKSGVLKTQLGLCMPKLAGLKTLNRLEQVILKKEADQQGWSEALTLDINNEVVEGVSSNCFIYLNNTWITPELRYNGVRGVMRAEIIDRMQQLGIECIQRPVQLTELSQVQSLFFCNALHPMNIVTHLQSQTLQTNICTQLYHILNLNQID
ncbi:4-amino-4-deoxychorismate lyase [Acinetobacter baylyi]|uniref:Aminodeoxychorismate lyase n=2 Tax=Acinetobacter baylyi TaxID=202950 RepID=A0ABU0V087_ACIBI|nr:4-amino-4-deoxychorismate lyase [Acinetobacter baylyi]MDR6106176.1 4-amino-4-deoxychorismate lyase [Acinetobacter baylyi]MDR6187100.1 4-amino-4-deoxychorismate lyase [Acinetobacter baylyi]